MSETIQKVQIFGQRCSGTTYLEKLLQSNFNDLKIVSYYGFKHAWNGKLKRPLGDVDHIKIIIIVRDPYDWLRSVHRAPHHCAQLLGLKFDSFIREPWIAYRSKDWNNFDRRIRLKTVNDNKIIESFENVMDCRNQKMRLFKEIDTTEKSVLPIRYENLRDSTESLLNLIEDKLQLKNRRSFKQIYDYYDSGKTYKPKRYLRIPSRSLELINTTLDWNTEGYFGYEKKQAVPGTMIDINRLKFLSKQWVYENIIN